MAEATQATTTTATPAPSQTDATPAPAEGVDTSTAAPTKPLSVMERVEAALAKSAAAKDASEKPKDGETTVTEPAKEGAETKTDETKPPEPKPEEKKPEEPKKEDPRLSRSLAIIAEREEKVRREQKALETRQAEWSKQQQSDAADLALLKTVREALAKDGEAAALEAMGITLPRAVELMSRKVEPTADDIQRKIVREEIAAVEKANREATERAEREKTERAAADEQVKQTEFLDRVVTLDPTAYPFSVQRKVTGAQIWDVAKKLSGDLGRPATHVETMDHIEKLLLAEAEAVEKLLASRRPPAESAPTITPTPAAKPAEVVKPKAPDKGKEPAEQPSRRPGKREGAIERAEAALRRQGIH